MSGYILSFYKNPETSRVPVEEYINDLATKEQAKIYKYMAYLRENDGVLDEPYSKHIRDKIRELRVDFSKNHHRIFYFTFIGKNIVMLHAFLKNTDKTPESEINKALNNYLITIKNLNAYEEKIR
jgi:phage-related protein